VSVRHDDRLIAKREGERRQRKIFVTGSLFFSVIKTAGVEIAGAFTP
jgi:hypothetical protein